MHIYRIISQHLIYICMLTHYEKCPCPQFGYRIPVLVHQRIFKTSLGTAGLPARCPSLLRNSNIWAPMSVANEGRR